MLRHVADSPDVGVGFEFFFPRDRLGTFEPRPITEAIKAALQSSLLGFLGGEVRRVHDPATAPVELHLEDLGIRSRVNQDEGRNENLVGRLDRKNFPAHRLPHEQIGRP
jgi:hypothetical protein